MVVLPTRRFLALASACGLAASLAAYSSSFKGVTMDGIGRYAVLLHVGVFVLLLPMFAEEHALGRRLSWEQFAQGMPQWVAPFIKLLGLFFAVHFVLFLLQSHGAAPEMGNGKYVLNNHGRIVKIITESEYKKLKGAELRLFATVWIFFYFVPMTYWWFPRTRQRD